MSIYVMLVKNNFRDTPDFLLRGFFYDQSDTLPHMQEFFEIAFVLDGTGKHYTPGNMEPISRRDILIIPVRGVHGYYETKKLRIFNLLFVMEKLPLPQLNLLSHPGFKYLFTRNHEFFESQGHYPKLHLSEEKFLYLEELLHHFSDASSNETPGRNCTMLGFFLAIVSTLCDNWEAAKAADPAFSTNVAKAVTFLNSNYKRPIYLDEVAKYCSMSKNTLLRNFRRMMGCSPMEYLLQIRLANACSMLLNTSFRVGEIAEQCGVEDTAFFSRIFKKKLGRTPNEYRQSEWKK